MSNIKYHIYIILAFVSLGYSQSMAQEAYKMLQVWSNGEMRFQMRYDSIDSITFSVPKPPITPTINEKKLSGLFSVSPTLKVRFSSGNLQYQASTNTWRFALNQYDIIGDSVYGNVYENEVKCDNGKASASYDGWIDEFAMWTSGFDNTKEDTLATRFHPWDREENVIHTRLDKVKDLHIYPPLHYYGYGPNYFDVDDDRKRDSLVDLLGKYANYDWGVYNPISNGGNKEGMWRTLTGDEWSYLIHFRQPNNRGYAIVNSIVGLVLLPDDWAEQTGQPKFISSPDTCTENIYTVEEWLQLERIGAVFLPCGDQDYGVYHSVDNRGSLHIMPNIGGTSGFIDEIATHSEPCELQNVRLVQDVESDEQFKENNEILETNPSHIE